MPRKAKRKAKMPTVSQRVKQDQTVKINIKNLLPPQMERSGDYIRPQRGMPMDKNLNMGNQTRLVGPSIQYAIRPPEFLPLPERFNSQGQPSYVREAPARVGRPDLITTETNPSDIVPSGASVRAIPSQGLPPVFKAVKIEPVSSVFESKAAPSLTPRPPAREFIVIDDEDMDESQDLVASQAGPSPSLSRRQMAQQRRRGLERIAKEQGAAPVTGSPTVPSSGFPVIPRTPAAMAAMEALSPREEKDEV